MSSVPRREIDELFTRWTLAKLPLLVVEGPSDERFLSLVQKEKYCTKTLRDLDIWPAEYIEIPQSLTDKYGFQGTGAKQRAISFAKEVEANNYCAGFRSVVDKDLDVFAGANHNSAALLYTDFSCMEGYFWTPEVLRRTLIQYKCEHIIATNDELSELYISIGVVCAKLAAIRLVGLLNLSYSISLHQSDKALQIINKKLNFNLPLFVGQCNPAKSLLTECHAAVSKAQADLQAVGILDLINGHDLLWLLTYSLRELSKFPRRMIEQDVVFASLVSHGVTDAGLIQHPLFNALENWVHDCDSST